MSMTLVGIVDYSGQTHCMAHAMTVSSYQYEVYSVDPARDCWCGARVGTVLDTVPHPRIWPNYIDDPKGN